MENKRHLVLQLIATYNTPQKYKHILEECTTEQLLKYLHDVPDYRTKEDLVYIALYQLAIDLGCTDETEELEDLIDNLYTETELELLLN